ncbi:MAG: hemin uptake protein HemP [Burkholderiaceae bacterium]
MHTDNRTRLGRANAQPGVGGLPANGEPVVVDSQLLLGKSRELLILHKNRLYRLRETASGKLILTA